MKNKLPEKILGEEMFINGISMIKHMGNDSKVNEIIDYIAELTKVVEGKEEAEYYESLPNLAPGLKETLLGEVHTKIRKIYDFGTALAHRNDFNDGYNNALKDVEAIINRLMP